MLRQAADSAIKTAPQHVKATGKARSVMGSKTRLKKVVGGEGYDLELERRDHQDSEFETF
jgi:hypothetical protein